MENPHGYSDHCEGADGNRNSSVTVYKTFSESENAPTQYRVLVHRTYVAVSGLRSHPALRILHSGTHTKKARSPDLERERVGFWLLSSPTKWVDLGVTATRGGRLILLPCLRAQRTRGRSKVERPVRHVPPESAFRESQLSSNAASERTSSGSNAPRRPGSNLA